MRDRPPPQGNPSVIGRARFAGDRAARVGPAVRSRWAPLRPLVLAPHAPGGYILGDGSAPLDPARAAVWTDPGDSAEVLCVSAGVVVALVRFGVGRPPAVLRCPVGAWAALFREVV